MTSSASPLTAADFAADRHELPDGGRWTELVEGRPVVLDPPDEAHGTVVLNLSKAIAAAMAAGEDIEAAPSFDLGLKTRSDPDTLRFPAVSVFRGGNRFAAVGEVYSERTPNTVVEIAADRQRRLHCGERVLEYHELGVKTVWVVDPVETAVTVATRGREPKVLRDSMRLAPLLDLTLDCTVEELFETPKWYR